MIMQNIQTNKNKSDYEENEELAKEYFFLRKKGKKNDRRLREIEDKVISASEGLIKKIAGYYYSLCYHRRKNNEDDPIFEDLMQEGRIGTLGALRRYSPYKNTKYSTYAVWWIRCCVLKQIAGDSAIYIPSQMMDKRRKINRFEADFYTIDGQEPEIEEIMKNTGLSKGIIETYKKMPRKQRTYHEDESSGRFSFHETQSDLEEEIRRVLSFLDNGDSRLREVLMHRFGFYGERRTFKETAMIMNLKRQRVQQLQEKALKRLETISHFRENYSLVYLR